MEEGRLSEPGLSPEEVFADIKAGRLSEPGLSPEEVFADINNRRAGILKALTTDYEKFYNECDPDSEDISLGLYGLPGERWKVNKEDKLAKFPEPSMAINHTRDELGKRKWVQSVASYSDAWLIALAFFYAHSNGFDKAMRQRLFTLMNAEPTILESVREAVNRPSMSSKKCNKSMAGSKKVGKGKKRTLKDAMDKNDDNGENLCGGCECEFMEGELPISCDTCHKRFHCYCVKVSLEAAKSMKHYKCPLCFQKKKQPS